MTIPDQEVDRIINWEDFFSRIQQATGISDLNTLTKTIIQGEEKNFALFKFVNELNTEITAFET